MIESRFSLLPYIMLTKPGIVLGNVLAAMGAYFVVRAQFDVATFLAMSVGTAFVIAGSCVINNYLDRDIDVYMKRTAKRPSVTGVISARVGLPYAALLLVAGFGLLFWLTPLITALLGLFGALSYVVAYGFAKRKTHWGTFVGAFPGAVPPLAGYVAAAGALDWVAYSLFAMMFTWQMVHFYAITLFRMKEYGAAGIPVLPVAKSIKRTLIEMRLYGLLFVLATIWLTIQNGAGFTFLLIMIPLALYWLLPLNQTIHRDKLLAVARTIFGRSLIVLLAMSTLWALTDLLP